MPEAAIDKNNDPFAAKHEIGLPEEIDPASPAGNAMGTHDLDQSEFGVLVAP